MRILLVGRQGQVAYELARTLACLGQVIALDRATSPVVDLDCPESLASIVQAVAPDVIVNAAAYTAVDQAESERERAWRINAEAPGALARAAAARGAVLLHYSTDYVFHGAGSTPWREDDETGPLGVYGESKLAGEHAIAASGAAYFIFRTAWVYGARGKNFLLTMLRLLNQRPELSVVDDQRGAPTWSRMIAESTASVVAKMGSDPLAFAAAHAGIYHMAAGGEGTWCDFARAIREGGVARGLLNPDAAVVRPIATADYPTPARRPAYSVLDSSKLARVFGIAMPAWQDGLSLCLDELGERQSRT